MDSDPVAFAKALADDTRQQIMQHLCCAWLNVGDIVDALGGRVNQPTVSHHLRKLQEAGLVLARQKGRQHYYMLNQEYLTSCCGRLISTFAPAWVDKMLCGEVGVEALLPDMEQVDHE
jgi:DNA-binding transcriptional ArsR family regulator